MMQVTLDSGVVHKINADSITSDPSWVTFYKRVERKDVIVAAFPAKRIEEVINPVYVTEGK